MKSNDLKNLISSCLNDISFTQNGKPCGITTEVHDSIPTFQVWCGDNIKEYDNVRDVVSDKFYDGKSLTDLLCSETPIQYMLH